MKEAAAITFDGSVTNQVIDGFGVNANHRSWNNDDLKPVIDALVDQAGMTLFRVVYDKTDWEATNDNSDPNVMNWNYYSQVYSSDDFQRMWGLVGYLNQKGISNGLMLNFQGNGPAWLGGATLSQGMEAEWAETIASLLVWARQTNNLCFSLVGPDNEMDQAVQGVGMTVTQYTNALHKLSQLLDTNGLSDLRFVGPDLSGGGITNMPQMLADPVVMSKVAHFGLHSYAANGSGSAGVASYIQSSAYPDRTVWMTEYNVWCPQCDSGISGTNTWSYASAAVAYLCAHLANGASAGLVWEAYDSQYNYYSPGQWSFWGLFSVDDTNAAAKTYTARKIFYTLSQVSKWVPPGAQMIGVSGSTSPFSPLQAFYHRGLGRVTIVGINPNSTPAALVGTNASLPSLLSLALYYTSPTTNLAYGGSIGVTNGQFNAMIPSNCVFTLTGAPGVQVTITNPASGATFNAPAAIPLAAAAATTTGTVQNVAFYSSGVELGETYAAPYAVTWTNVPMGDYAITAIASDTAGNTCTSPVVNVTVVGALAQVSITPTNAIVPLGDTTQFAVTGSDALGNVLNPQPAFSWSVNYDGTINSTGLFTAGGLIGGPVQVVASSGGVAGTALVSVVSTNVNGTFGNTNDGTLTDSLYSSGSWINACRFLAASNTQVSTVSAKVVGVSGRYQCAIYTDSGGNPSGLLGGTAQLTNTSSGWRTFKLATPTTLTNGQYYWLAIWSDDTNAAVYYSASNGVLRWGKYTYGTWPNPVVTTGGSTLDYCIRADTGGKTNPAVSWSSPADIVYGTALSATQLNATSPVPGTFTYTPPAGTVLNAGLSQWLYVAFVPQDTNGFFGAIASVPLNVQPKPLTVTVSNAARLFAQSNPAFGGTISGLVPGDNISASYGTIATPSSPVGTYPIAPAFIDPASRLPDYAVTISNGTLTILQAASALTWPSPAPVTYGTALTSAQLNATANVPGSFVYTPAAGAILPAGSAALSVLFTPADSLDYTPASGSVNLPVQPAPLTVTASNVSRSYGQTNPVLGGIITGIQNGDNITATYSTPATTNSALGNYLIIPALVDPSGRLPNYLVTSNAGTLTIVQATPLLSWPAPAPVVYGTALGAGQLNASASVPGVFAYNPPAGTVLASGTNALMVSFSPTDTTNYLGTTAGVTLAVMPAPLSVAANDASRPYGQPNPSLSGTIAGLTNGDLVTASYNTSASVSSPAGNYPILPSLADPGQRLTNYSITTTLGTLTVGKIALTITANSTSKVYGQSVSFAGSEFTAAGLIGADSVTSVALVSAGAGAGASVPGSPYSIVPSAAVGNGLTNYNLGYANGSLVVTPAPLSLTTSNASRAFGQINPVLSGSLVGLLNGDNITASYNTTATIDSPAGTYPIAPSLMDPQNRLVNYTVTTNIGTLTIGLPPQITLQPTNQTLLPGATAQFSVQASGSGVLAYQWWFNETNLLEDATNSMLTLTNITYGQLGDYQVVVSSDYGSVTSAVVMLAVVAWPPSISGFSYSFTDTNAVSGALTLTFSAWVNPENADSTAWFQYGLTSAYAGSSLPATLPQANVASPIGATLDSAVPGANYHCRVVASNSLGTTFTSDQVVAVPPLYVPGDLNGDGKVDQTELNAVLSNYWPNSPWVTMTNVAGLRSTNVQFALTNANGWDFSVLMSTNLVDWQYLGLATPFYQFTDPAATNAPQRFYRLRWP